MTYTPPDGHTTQFVLAAVYLPADGHNTIFILDAETSLVGVFRWFLML